MYPPAYSYGNATGQPYHGAPQGQNPQMQPGPGSNQPHQSMMYNQQQYPMGPGGGGGGGGGSNSAYSGAPNSSAMMPGTAGPAGMMQNTALPQVPNNVGYQPPFTSSPYGPNVPSTAAAPHQGQYNSNYMMPNATGGYPMNAAGMSPQHQQQQMMMQRMHHAQQNQAGMGTPAQQRQFSGSQGTPNPGQQSQFGTPPNPSTGTPQPHHTPTPTPTTAPQSANSVTTPQTPTFPLLGQGPSANGNSAPASPGAQAKDQERFSLLLDINTELLYEAMFLKHAMAEIRKEVLGASHKAAEQEELRKEEQSFGQDFVHVSRRLQANLQYLASLTTNKPDAVRQPAPMYLSSPPFNLDLKLRTVPATAENEELDGATDREEREKGIKDLYERLQALFPGVDHTKEPTSTPAMDAIQNAQRKASMGAQMQGSSAPSPVSSVHQTTPKMSTVSGPPSTSSA